MAKRKTTEEMVDQLVQILKKVKKPLGPVEFCKRSKHSRTTFYKWVNQAIASGRIKKNDDSTYALSRKNGRSGVKNKPGRKSSKTKTCRDCGESKPLNDQNWSRMSSIVTAKTGEIYYPNCRVCKQVTPTVRGTIQFVEDNGIMTAKKMAEATGMSVTLCSNRLRTAHKAGYLDRKGVGIYAINEEGRELDTSNAVPLSSRSINKGRSNGSPQNTSQDFTRGVKLMDVVLNRGGLDDDDQVTLEVARGLIAGGAPTGPERGPDVVIAEL
jgi:hypothetical protein